MFWRVKAHMYDWWKTETHLWLLVIVYEEEKSEEIHFFCVIARMRARSGAINTRAPGDSPSRICSASYIRISEVFSGFSLQTRFFSRAQTAVNRRVDKWRYASSNARGDHRLVRWQSLLIDATAVEMIIELGVYHCIRAGAGAWIPRATKGEEWYIVFKGGD